jgi:glutathione-regulated potassium-efflux system ancillary protein KefF
MNAIDSAPPALPTDILVIVAHPSLEQSRANQRLMKAAQQLPMVQVRDLYALYPDYLIDIGAEQAALRAAKLVVWQHPIHWYGMTPMMKLYLDEVLAFNWAYGPTGDALRGKDVWLVASTGGPEDSYHPTSYNRYLFDAFLPPYEQTAALCGMRFLQPMLLHAAHQVSEAALAEHAAVYAQRLSSYPDWPELDEVENCVDCEVPTSARPSDDTNTISARPSDDANVNTNSARPLESTDNVKANT